MNKIIWPRRSVFTTRFGTTADVTIIHPEKSFQVQMLPVCCLPPSYLKDWKICAMVKRPSTLNGHASIFNSKGSLHQVFVYIYIENICPAKLLDGHPLIKWSNRSFNYGNHLGIVQPDSHLPACATATPHLLDLRYHLFGRLTSWGNQSPTVDGQNPAPPRMMIIPLFIGF